MKLRLTVAILEKHSQSVSKNTKTSFTVSALPGKIFHALLSRNGGFLQQKLRSVTAEFDVMNKDLVSGGRIRAGKTGDAQAGSDILVAGNEYRPGAIRGFHY